MLSCGARWICPIKGEVAPAEWDDLYPVTWTPEVRRETVLYRATYLRTIPENLIVSKFNYLTCFAEFEKVTAVNKTE